jgi:hypothetical protein
MSEKIHKAVMLTESMATKPAMFGPLCGARWVAGRTKQHPWTGVVTCEACLAKLKESSHV